MKNLPMVVKLLAMGWFLLLSNERPKYFNQAALRFIQFIHIYLMPNYAFFPSNFRITRKSIKETNHLHLSNS